MNQILASLLGLFIVVKYAKGKSRKHGIDHIGYVGLDAKLFQKVLILLTLGINLVNIYQFSVGIGV